MIERVSEVGRRGCGGWVICIFDLSCIIRSLKYFRSKCWNLDKLEHLVYGVHVIVSI